MLALNMALAGLNLLLLAAGPVGGSPGLPACAELAFDPCGEHGSCLNASSTHHPTGKVYAWSCNCSEGWKGQFCDICKSGYTYSSNCTETRRTKDPVGFLWGSVGQCFFASDLRQPHVPHDPLPTMLAAA